MIWFFIFVLVVSSLFLSFSSFVVDLQAQIPICTSRALTLSLQFTFPSYLSVHPFIVYSEPLETYNG
jgi:hypothetical protein